MLLNVGMLSTTGRQAEREMFSSKGILSFVGNGKDIQKPCNFFTIPPTLKLPIQREAETTGREEKAGCHSTHENDAFWGDGAETRLLFRREAPSRLSRSVFRNLCASK